MTNRKKHPGKEIEKAIQYAENKEWLYKPAGNSAHAWGILLCPLHTSEGCRMSIWSTPRDEFVHAEQIRRRTKKCPHVEENFHAISIYFNAEKC